jgi:hypothetical protein
MERIVLDDPLQGCKQEVTQLRDLPVWRHLVLFRGKK